MDFMFKMVRGEGLSKLGSGVSAERRHFWIQGCRVRRSAETPLQLQDFETGS
jgi:hypothetical protein